MRLKTQIDFEGNTECGSQLNWHVEPCRIDGSDEIWVHVVDDESGKVVFEILLSEWNKIGEALAIANKAELEVEYLGKEI